MYIVPSYNSSEFTEKPAHLTLLVKNQEGWVNLCQMLTTANLDGFYRVPRIDHDVLLNHLKGLIVLSGCQSNVLRLHKDGIGFITKLENILREDFYYEVMPHNMDEAKTLNRRLWERVLLTRIKLVATNDCHYINKGDEVAQEVLLAIQRSAKWNDPDRWKFSINGLHLRTKREMISAFTRQGILPRESIEKAINAVDEIVEKCSGFRIKRNEVSLPSIVGEGASHNVLRRLCKEALAKDAPQEYHERLREELRVIKTKDFAGYFLIVHDLVSWCKGRGILIGPGRGSIGGSLVANLIGITDKSIDPIKHGLLFSRFISPDRIDYPDIDLDFEDRRRHEVLEYLKSKYGEDRVAGITTFMRMKSKAVVKDVARVFEVPFPEVNLFTGMMDNQVKGKDDLAGIQATIDMTKEGAEFARKYPKIVEISKKLEGQIRSYGRHAAGIIISDEDLKLGTRGNLAVRNNATVINWEKDDAEYMGLLKLDILGLNILSIFNEAKRLIIENHDNGVDFSSIPLDDDETIKAFARGDNTGCFQLNSHGISKLCRDVKVDSFDMLIHVNALYRPGPLRSGMVDEFIKRRKSGKWKSIHPLIDAITKDTYGIIIYQEQVMRLAHEVAGMSLRKADEIRKVISKSKGAEELQAFETAFVRGCIKAKTLSEKQASGLWNALKTFGGYVFNLAHSLEYTTIGYWCQYLKAHYPLEFFCASLTYGSDDNKREIVEEVYKRGLPVILPKVGTSDAFLWKVNDKKLYVPFIEVHGIGDKTALDAVKRLQPAQQNQIGFFEKELTTVSKITKMDKILLDIGAFEEGLVPPENAKKYFKNFRVSIDPLLAYPNLTKYWGTFQNSLASILNGEIYKSGIVAPVTNGCISYKDCLKCSLRNECTAPVDPSKGLFNVAIIGEAPGRDEDVEGEGFVGRASVLLWEELRKYRLLREMFWVTNVCHCWPSTTKTPLVPHIEACFEQLKSELKLIDCRLALVFGNTGIKAFTGKTGGITALSGTTQWIDNPGLWVCWGVHPAALLRSGINTNYFEEGIANFAKKFKFFKRQRR